jgi:hypothetical protein
MNPRYDRIASCVCSCYAWGLYVVGLGMMSSFIFMVTGAWLLLVGVGTAEAAEARSTAGR